MIHFRHPSWDFGSTQQWQGPGALESSICSGSERVQTPKSTKGESLLLGKLCQSRMGLWKPNIEANLLNT